MCEASFLDESVLMHEAQALKRVVILASTEGNMRDDFADDPFSRHCISMNRRAAVLHYVKDSTSR